MLDNLNTHTPASFYEVFPPEQAKALIDRLEIHYTPKHAGWLNIAEIEFSVLARQAWLTILPLLRSYADRCRVGSIIVTSAWALSTGNFAQRMLASS